LQPGSPAIDRVSPTYAPVLDLDGNARPFPNGGLADMGCYEAQWQLVFVPLVLRNH
jgi:hypothetical protein